MPTLTDATCNQGVSFSPRTDQAAYPLGIRRMPDRFLRRRKRGETETEQEPFPEFDQLGVSLNLSRAAMGNQSSQRIHEAAVACAGKLTDGIGEALPGGHLL